MKAESGRESFETKKCSVNSLEGLEFFDSTFSEVVGRRRPENPSNAARLGVGWGRIVGARSEHPKKTARCGHRPCGLGQSGHHALWMTNHERHRCSFASVSHRSSARSA